MSIRLRLALWYGALLSLVLAAALSLAFVDHARSHEEDVAFAKCGKTSPRGWITGQ